MSCRSGRYLAGNPNYQCTANGWTGGSASCQRVTCGALTGLDNAHANCATTGATSVCEAQCDEGYVLDRSSKAEYVCDNTGFWTGGDIRCNPVDCGYVDTDRSTVFVSKTGSVYRDTATLACAEGYLGRGGELTCSASGRWTGSIDCTPVDCGSLPGFPHAIEQPCADSTLGNVCNVDCVAGYQKDPQAPSQDGQLVCGSNGQWQGSIQCITQRCPRLSVGNAHIVNPAVNYGPGDSVEVTCNSGYESATTTFNCNARSQWEGSLTCRRVNCGALPIPSNGRVDSCTGTLFEATCRTSCKTGFASPYEGVYTCGADGQWQGFLDCEPVRCGALDNLPKLAAAPQKCDGKTYGETCTAYCLPGSVEADTSVNEYTCSENGEWVGGSVSCIPNSCGLRVPNLSRNSYADCSSITTNAVCKAKCDENFHLIGNSSFLCTADGAWRGCSYECTRELLLDMCVCMSMGVCALPHFSFF